MKGRTGVCRDAFLAGLVAWSLMSKNISLFASQAATEMLRVSHSPVCYSPDFLH